MVDCRKQRRTGQGIVCKQVEAARACGKQAEDLTQPEAERGMTNNAKQQRPGVVQAENAKRLGAWGKNAEETIQQGSRKGKAERSKTARDRGRAGSRREPACAGEGQAEFAQREGAGEEQAEFAQEEGAGEEQEEYAKHPGPVEAGHSMHTSHRQ